MIRSPASRPAGAGPARRAALPSAAAIALALLTAGCAAEDPPGWVGTEALKAAVELPGGWSGRATEWRRRDLPWHTDPEATGLISFGGPHGSCWVDVYLPPRLDESGVLARLQTANLLPPGSRDGRPPAIPPPHKIVNRERMPPRPSDGSSLGSAFIAFRYWDGRRLDLGGCVVRGDDPLDAEVIVYRIVQSYRPLR